MAPRAFLVVVTLTAAAVAAAEPMVSNVRTSRLADGTGRVEVLYELAGAPAGGATVSVAFSTDGGETFAVAPAAGALSGDVGDGVRAGGDKRIVWDATQTAKAAREPLRLQAVIRAAGKVADAANCGVTTYTLPGGVPLDMICIPAGTFMMGSPASEQGHADLESLHQVTLTRDFWLGKYEVTQAQWLAVMGMNPAYNESCGSSCPVERTSWNDACGGTTGADCGAASFIGKLNLQLGTTSFRLPTEAEWERAARADTQTRFGYGDALECGDGCEACTTHDQYMWWCGNAGSGTHATGGKQPNAYGLYDMHGNVWEWVADWYGPYGGNETDPQGPATGTVRGLRGGSWNHAAQNCRSACRFNDDPDTRKYNFGVRLARSISVPVAPDAAFTWSPMSPQAGQTVQLTDTSTGSPTAWSWSFGDGGTSTAQSPTHVFATAGSFDVTLTATNATGSDAVTQSVTVTAAGTTPDAAFTWSPMSPQAGQTVQLTDTSTGSPTAWSWSFGDGGTSTAQSPTHVFATAGAFDVTLTATNAYGADSVTQSVTVTAAGTPPDAAFTWSPASPQAGQTVQLTDTSTGPPTSWSWNFGDGGTSTEQSPTHVFATAGSFDVTLTATNAFGSDSLTQTVTVTAAGTAPDAAFTWSPTSPQAGQTVQLTDTSTGSPTSSSWSFGDGGTSTEQSPTHVFATAGSFDVTLTATNAYGSDAVTHAIAVTSTATLEVFGIEVTQGIQNLADDTMLVEGRPTFVRVHARPGGTLAGVPPARLCVRRSGLLLGCLAPANSPILTGSPDRTERDQSLLFQVPAGWVSETLDFQLELETSEAALVCTNPQGGCAVHGAVVSPRLDVRIRVLPYSCASGSCSPSADEVAMAEREVAAVLPLSSVAWSLGTPMVAATSPDTAADFEVLVSDVQWRRRLDCALRSCEDVYLGLLGYSGSPQTLGAAGSANRAAVAYVTPPGDRQLAISHELAHVVAREHSFDDPAFPCPGDPLVASDETIDCDRGGLDGYTGDDSGYFGFAADGFAIAPHDASELMSFGPGPRWPSRYTYEGIYHNVVGKAGLKVGSLLDGPFVLVQGTVDVAGGQGRIARLLQLASIASYSPPAPGDLTLELIDGSGATIASYPFAAESLHTDSPSSPEELGVRYFTQLLPWDERARSVRLLESGSPLDERSASGNPPSVTLLAPIGGESYDSGSLSVTWTASDADGDSLQATVLYSHDDGQTWEALGVGLTGGALETPLATLAGAATCRVRVLVSDGFDTASDESDAVFAVANQAPRCSIAFPLERSLFTPGQLVILQGSAFDAEDGALHGSSLEWSSSLDGVLGSGAELEVSTDDLSVGEHTITLRATDSAGATCETAVSVETAASVDSPPIGTAAAYVNLVPASAHSAGLAGTSWVTDLVLHNPGDEVALGNLYFLESARDNRTAGGRRLRLPPGEALAVDDAVAAVFGKTAATGALLVAADRSLLVSSRTYNDAATGTYGQYVPGPPVATALGAGEEARLIQLAGNAAFRTNIGFANATDSSLSVNVDLRGADGASLGTNSYTIPPYGHYQLGALAAGVDDAYAVVSSTTAGARYLTYASVVDNRTGDPVLVMPAKTAAGEPLYVAAAAHVAGAVGTNWRTDLEVHNPGPADATFTIALLASDQANPTPASVTFSLAAGRSARYPDAVSELFGHDGTGALRVTATAGDVMVTSRTYNDVASGTYGQAIAAARASQAIRQGQQGWLIQLAHSTTPSDGYRTNLGLVNAGGSNVAVEVKLHDAHGELLGTVTRTLAPFEHRQLNNVFTQVTAEGVKAGYAVVSTPTSGGRFFAYASVVDNRSGDPIFIPAAVTGSAVVLPPTTAPLLTATALSESEIALTWTAVAEATGYRLLRGSTGVYLGSSLAYTDSGLGSGSQYCYTVSAYNAAGDGPASAQACATTGGSQVEITITLPGGVPLALRRISAGTFTMGSPAAEADRGSDEDLHQVTLTRDYFIGVTEVTQAQWQAVMGSNPSNFRSCGDDCPVEKVSWNMVAGPDGFVERLNQYLANTGQAGAGLFRLPTEAEWERAARAGTTTRYSYGDAASCNPDCVLCADHDAFIWWCGNADGTTHPARSKEPNDLGLFDMHGNVWEWVQDVYQEHLGTAAQTDPTGPAPPGDRAMRGGSWYWHASSCRSAARHKASTTVTNYTYGFRLARSS